MFIMVSTLHLSIWYVSRSVHSITTFYAYQGLTLEMYQGQKFPLSPFMCAKVSILHISLHVYHVYLSLACVSRSVHSPSPSSCVSRSVPSTFPSSCVSGSVPSPLPSNVYQVSTLHHFPFIIYVYQGQYLPLSLLMCIKVSKSILRDWNPHHSFYLAHKVLIIQMVSGVG